MRQHSAENHSKRNDHDNRGAYHYHECYVNKPGTVEPAPTGDREAIPYFANVIPNAMRRVIERRYTDREIIIELILSESKSTVNKRHCFGVVMAVM